MGAPAGIDWEWAKATGGTLSAEQRRALLKPLARTVLSYVHGRARLAVGLRGNGRLDIDALGTTSSTSCAATGRPSPSRCRTVGPAG